MACNGLEMGSFYLFGHRMRSRLLFRKTHICAIFDPILGPKQSIFRAFWHLPRAKRGNHELKTCQKHLFWDCMWSRINFGKKNGLCAPVELR